jgi:hypothetical protein
LALIDWKETYDHLKRGERAGEAAALLIAISKRLGFASMFIGEIPPDSKLMDDQMLFYDPDDKWPLHYSSRNFRHVDPIIPLVKSLKYDVIPWALAKTSIRQNSQAARMYLEARKFGIEDGIMFVRYTHNHTIGYAQFMGSKECLSKLSWGELRHLQTAACITLVKEAEYSTVHEIHRQPPKLSPRMYEVLHPVLEGWTNEAIAQQYGTTSGAVEAIISKLYSAFDVPDNKYLNKRVTLCNRARLYNLSPIEPVLTKRPDYEISRGPHN